MPTTLAKFTFLCRTRIVQVGANFKGGNKFTVCPLCKVQYDCQKHLHDYTKLTDANTICGEVPQYDDLFSKDLTKMLIVVQIQKTNSEKDRRFYQNLNEQKPEASCQLNIGPNEPEFTSYFVYCCTLVCIDPN